LEEAQLIRAILDGDEAARDQMVAQHQRRLLATAWHFLGPQDPEAEDAVQETFLAAFKALPGFEGRSSLYTWLNHICVNQCFTLLRKRKRLLATEREDLERLAEAKAEPVQHASAEQAMVLARRRKLGEWMGKLNDKCRQILDLRFVQDKALAQIKEDLRVPIGTVASRLRRCQQQLQAIAGKS